MIRRKKTRTKFTDHPPARHSRKQRQIRAEVAAEAARIMATEELYNYHSAKKKAAERVGVSDRAVLPSNIEVEEALRSYRELYGGQKHRDNLERLRHTAVRAMHILQTFNPRLVGPVLDGTAGENSRVAFHLFSETPDSVLLFFLEHSAPFRQEQRQIRWYDNSQRLVPLILFDFEEQVVELMLFDMISLRQAPPCPVDGKPQRRATISDVESLLAENRMPRLSTGASSV
jgi:hypothetical protein